MTQEDYPLLLIYPQDFMELLKTRGGGFLTFRYKNSLDSVQVTSVQQLNVISMLG